MELLSWLLIQNFKKEKTNQAELYRLELESIINNNDEVKINENNIGVAYNCAGSYFYKKGNKIKAKELFRKGLEYVPGNEELETKLRLITLANN